MLVNRRQFVKGYYDARNIASRVHAPYGEPARLGRRMHQVHVKNSTRKHRVHSSTLPNG